MTEPPRWHHEAWIPLLAGLYWLWSAPGHGLLGFVFSVVPGTLMLASGAAMFLMPGDLRISQFAALGGLLGAVLALPAFLVVGFGHGVALVALSAASCVAAGMYTTRVEPQRADVPAVEPTLGLAAEVAIDELILATDTLTAMAARAPDYARIRREIEAARELFESAGWLEKPVEYHMIPPPLDSPALVSASAAGADYEHLSFESGYSPREGEPGRERWNGYAPNRTAHAWVLRHRDGPRPWLICIHGYRMGQPTVDIGCFRPGWLHRQLGLNLLLPVLPLHGVRASGWRSGQGFVGAEVLDTIHAEAQTIWDIRRMIGWLRAQEATGIGAYGLSLGGYNTALLASLHGGLACAIAGVPASDFARLLFRHSPIFHARQSLRNGVGEAQVAEVLRVVSPLVLNPLIPRERRFLFGAPSDRIVPADQVCDLWRHWERPRLEWYPGGHLTFGAHPGVRELVEEGLRAGALAS